MQKPRRQFVLRAALGSAIPPTLPAAAGPLTGTAPFVTPPSIGPALKAWVDTLIPADATPSGSALGVDRRMQATAQRSPGGMQLLEQGIAWLDRQSRADFGRDFAQLDEAGRESVAARAASAAQGSLPRVFFEQTRANAFSHYYAQPASWRGIPGYQGAPQPRGFMDQAEPPRATRR